MKVLFGVLLAAVVTVAGAEGLAAQQPSSGMRSDSTHHTMRHHTTTRHTSTRTTTHTTRHAARHHTASHARTHVRRARTTARASMTRTRTRPAPVVIGREIGPSGISSTGRIQRLPSGLITPDAARTIALRSVSGGSSVGKIDLQTEDGRQVYDVKVMTPGRTGNEKVRVDAHTGQVLETKNVDNPIGTATNAVKGTVNRVTGKH